MIFTHKRTGQHINVVNDNVLYGRHLFHVCNDLKTNEQFLILKTEFEDFFERNMDVRGDYIQTFTGKKFYPLDPRPEDIEIEDIAHALSLTCRFGGHIKILYSIAQHSLGVCSALSEKKKKKGLLHDGSEAFISDIVTPAKRYMKQYYAIEENIQNTIYRKFGCEIGHDEEIHEIDRRALVTEAEYLSSSHVEKWWSNSGIKHLENYIPEYRNPLLVKRDFIDMFESLD